MYEEASISIYHAPIFTQKRVSVVNNSLNLRAAIPTSMAKFPCLIDTVCYFCSLFPISTLSIIHCYDRPAQYTYTQNTEGQREREREEMQQYCIVFVNPNSFRGLSPIMTFLRISYVMYAVSFVSATCNHVYNSTLCSNNVEIQSKFTVKYETERIAYECWKNNSIILSDMSGWW